VVIYYGGKIQAMGTLNELLATPNTIQITTPALPRETMQNVWNVIRKDVTEDKVRVDTHTQNLESYFLGRVQKARQASARDFGAMSRRTVAAYLRGNQGELLRPIKYSNDSPHPRRQCQVPGSKPSPKVVVDQAKARAMTLPAEKTPPAQTTSRSKRKANDLEQANEKLSSLLDKPK
jgi:hypothetical protein